MKTNREMITHLRALMALDNDSDQDYIPATDNDSDQPFIQATTLPDFDHDC